MLQELLKKCHQCMETIVKAKDQQAAEANKNASILLKELDLEKVISDTRAHCMWRSLLSEYTARVRTNVPFYTGSVFCVSVPRGEQEAGSGGQA